MTLPAGGDGRAGVMQVVYPGRAGSRERPAGRSIPVANQVLAQLVPDAVQLGVEAERLQLIRPSMEDLGERLGPADLKSISRRTTARGRGLVSLLCLVEQGAER